MVMGDFNEAEKQYSHYPATAQWRRDNGFCDGTKGGICSVCLKDFDSVYHLKNVNTANSIAFFM